MIKTKNISLFIFWFVFISIIRVVPTQQCSDTGNFELNSTYGAIRSDILSSLASNVMKDGGFYNTSITKGPDQVYAMAMCIDGSEQKACSECIEIAVRQLKYNCLNQTEAFTWAPHKTLCYARYSNISFFGRLGTHPLYSEHTSVDIKSYLEAYEKEWKNAKK
ncbi:putative cysteine-rich receptor-like protein kinase 33 [Cardamine amara subsp. amara]|uniref:Cysteine-rich receptor-like protein kinase 33 n=1 Tax=Cardamine amara subsp. amara TaxID=228776 RepID=A0ABD1BAF3_CARAN